MDKPNMTEEQIKEIEALGGGTLKQSELDALGFTRNSGEFSHGVYELYHRQIGGQIEIEVNFILGEGTLTIFNDEEDQHLDFPLLFKNGEQLKYFIESFTY
jgi:hypothetical protein